MQTHLLYGLKDKPIQDIFYCFLFFFFLPLTTYWQSFPFTCSSTPLPSCFISVPPSVLEPLFHRVPVLFHFRWIWRWLCQARGKIRRSRCLCSGCPWSVSRCCWRRCRVTLTRSPKIPFRPWTSSHGICLPWGADAHHLCRLYKRTTHTHPLCFWQLLLFAYHLPVLLNFLLSFDHIIWCSVIAVPGPHPRGCVVFIA